MKKTNWEEEFNKIYVNATPGGWALDVDKKIYNSYIDFISQLLAENTEKIKSETRQEVLKQVVKDLEVAYTKIYNRIDDTDWRSVRVILRTLINQLK